MTKTIKAAPLSPPACADPRVRWDRVIDGLRKAGMPEEGFWALSSRQLIEQPLSLLQIKRIEALSKAAVHRSEKIASLFALAGSRQSLRGKLRRGVLRTLLAFGERLSARVWNTISLLPC